ncbi:MAG TPA: MFS transporter [Stellaceae bacterium]|jgi:MFS family permease|nr:MFS transporter [Stellaceae bacterium]
MLFAFNGRATRSFLALLVLMHFILFIDRVNLAAAAGVMQKDLGLSNIALGIAFSAFNYAYAPFQLVGGWFADRFGARRTLTVCGLVWSLTTVVTGAVTGLASLFAVRLVLGMGEGATLPAATRALSKWTPLAARGTAVGITHAAGRLGAGASAPIVAFLIIWFSWRFSFVVLGILSAVWAALWWWYFREDPRAHPAITSAELAALPAADPAGRIGSGPVPWRRLIPRVAPLMIIYFCQGWTGWLYVTWMPSLFQKNYGLDLKKSSLFYAAMLFSAMIAELLGGVVTDYLLRRTRSLPIARSLLIATSWVLAVAGLVPAIFIHDLVIGLAGFTVALFFLGFAISPLWTATMDIAPNYAGSSSALMNAAGAVAGIMSPVAFGWILTRTGSWTTPFAFSVGLLLFAIVMTYWIRPDRPIEATPRVGRLAVAGE